MPKNGQKIYFFALFALTWKPKMPSPGKNPADTLGLVFQTFLPHSTLTPCLCATVIYFTYGHIFSPNRGVISHFFRGGKLPPLSRPWPGHPHPLKILLQIWPIINWISGFVINKGGWGVGICYKFVINKGGWGVQEISKSAHPKIRTWVFLCLSISILSITDH